MQSLPCLQLATVLHAVLLIEAYQGEWQAKFREGQEDKEETDWRRTHTEEDAY